MPSPQVEMRTEQRQAQIATPRLQRAVRLLQMSSLDFAHELQSVLAENPFLEDEGEGNSPESPEAADAAHAADAERANDDRSLEDISPSSEPSDWVPGDPLLRRRSEGVDASAMDFTCAETTLREHLHAQTAAMQLTARDAVLVSTVIESLDDDGYLRLELAELEAVTALAPPPQAAELQVALRLVQSLDPMGVGARSVQECLLLQLSRIEDDDERAIARLVIEQHIDRLAQHHTPAIARALGCAPERVERACERIRRFDPRPGWRFGPVGTQYITPDVIVSRVGSRWQARLNPAIVPRVRMNRTYAEMFQRHRDGSHAELGRQLQEAHWTMRNVEQRFSTILSVAQAVLERQHAFLEHGPLAMRPLGLREVADEVGVHESTVSRVTNNKYMATPAGVFELKFFFSRAIPTAAGGACSATAIRGVIADLIAAENPQAPLSDVQLAARLARQGLQVARRTVTKYRQQLKLAAVEGRRQRH